MRKVITIAFGSVFGVLIIWIAVMLIIHFVNDNKIATDPTLYEGFKIIEEKQISAEDGMNFYTLQVETNHPKTPYRLYVFTSETKDNRLFFVDSYMHKITPKVNLIMDSKDESYYEIEDQIINCKNGEYSTIAAGYLDNFEAADEAFSEYVPVVKKLVEKESWFWLYEGAEFLLKSEERAYTMEVLSNFEIANKEKTEYSEPYYRSTLTYDKMLSKCNELLQKYGGEQ